MTKNTYKSERANTRARNTTTYSASTCPWMWSLDLDTTVPNYESTFVLSYNVVRRYECCTEVLSYHTKVLSYFRTKVQLQLLYVYVVHVRCLIKVVGPNGLTVHVHVYVYSKCCEGSSYFITTIITRVRVVYVYNVQLYESTFVHVYVVPSYTFLYVALFSTRWSVGALRCTVKLSALRL